MSGKVCTRTRRRQLLVRRCRSPRADNLGDSFAHRRKTRKEKAPTPKDTTGKTKHDGQSSHYKTKANENVKNPPLETRLDISVPPFPPARPIIRIKMISRWLRLRQSAGERLRNQTDIRAA